MTAAGDVIDSTTTTAEPTGDGSVAETNAEGTDQGMYAEPKAETDAEGSTTEAQEGEETEPESTDAKGDEADKPSEGYEFPLPEGVELDEAGAAAFNELGVKLGITQEQVNELAPFFAERLQQTATSVVDSITTQAQEQSQAWRDESLAAEDIGEAGVKVAADAISKFGSASLKKWLDESGAGNHPELARCFMRVGRAIAADTLENGDGGGADPADNVEERGIYAT